MSNYKYLDDNGLTYYHSKVKNLLAGKVDKVDGKGLSTNDYTTAEKNKLASVENGAEPNQNAFNRVVVGSTTIEADTETDALTITAGNNITLTPNSDNDSITISASVPEYSDATTTTHGLMSVADKNTLDKLDTLVDRGASGGSEQSTLRDYEWSSSKSYSQQDIVVYENGIYIALNTPTTGQFIASEWGGPTDIGGATISSVKTAFYLLKGFTTTIPELQNAIANKADINDPTLTGTPKAPTASAGTNTTQIATTAFVKTAVDNAIAGIAGIEFQIVTSLPTTGKTGTIYLVSNGGANPNSYDEYIWISSTNKFEKIGTTDVDLSGYVQASQMVAITNAEIDTIVA